MKTNIRRIISLAAPVLGLLGLAFLCALPAGAQGNPAQVEVLTNSVVSEPLAFDVSPPLSQMVQQAVPSTGVRRIVPRGRPKLPQLQAAANQGPIAGSALPALPGSAAPSIPVNVPGINGNPAGGVLGCPSVSGSQVAPPDTEMAVGDTQVVQWVNLCYAVFDKATGALIAGPFAGNRFWIGFKSTCASANAGDPIIQWDKANHVWVASQNVFGPYLTCVAVSKTADATGAYNRYAFTQPGFPDYPKWGLTPTVYYQTQNDFGIAGRSFVGVNVCAYDGVALRAGSKNATQICILDNSGGTLFDDSMLPADADSAPGSNPDTTEVLLGSIDNHNPGTNVYQYVFTVTFTKKGGTATLAGTNGSLPITVPTYSLACGGSGACIAQPSPGELLDSLGDRLMYRLARFVDSGGTQHFLVNHSVNNTTAVGISWYEFTATSGSTTLTLAQSGQTPDDAFYRWMGSAARNKNGDIAIGYSRSSLTDHPSIYLAGHLASESAGTTDAETLIYQGSGSQFSTANRWGDYSSMALDGVDGCTFWYTNEYYPNNGSFLWYTQMAKIKYNPATCP